MSFHLAQINVGRLLAPIDDPRIAEFVARLDEINALADRTPGFVWRMQTEAGNATSLPYNDDPLVIANMSVWESVEALRDYVYRSAHVDVMRKRLTWFEKPPVPMYCLWWIPAGHIPTLAEGRARLEHYQQHGATDVSFWFAKPAPHPATPAIAASE